MRTISIRLDDRECDELDIILKQMGQTKQTFYETFEDYAKAVDFPEAVDVKIDEEYTEKTYAGWLSQIIGGAYGTCIEGYTGDAIKKRYGEVDRYIRKPKESNLLNKFFELIQLDYLYQLLLDNYFPYLINSNPGIILSQ